MHTGLGRDIAKLPIARRGLADAGAVAAALLPLFGIDSSEQNSDRNADWFLKLSGLPNEIIVD